MSIRDKRRLITLGYILGSTFVFLILVLSASSHPGGLGPFFLVLLILNLILSRWIARPIQKSLITVAQCPHCGTMMDLHGVWKCPCGYTSKMHIFDKCKNCKEGFGYIPCPKCEVAIDI